MTNKVKNKPKKKSIGVKLISTKGKTKKELSKELDNVLDDLLESEDENMTDKKITNEKPISLYPLDFKEAVAAIMKVKPEPKPKKKPAKKTKPS